MIELSAVKAVTIPEGAVKAILCAGKTLWEAGGYTNQVPLSIDTDGSIYNGSGYKNGYRVRSGGTEAALNNCSVTGYIPAQGGDSIRLSGWDFAAVSVGNAINVYDDSFACLGQFTSQGSGYGIFATGESYAGYGRSSVTVEDDVCTWIMPPEAAGIRYLRLSGYDSLNGAPGARMIVTVNEEIG